ncbi:MAG: glycosyltransferase family 39 protein [Candidatus Omnitrophota bacterium]
MRKKVIFIILLIIILFHVGNNIRYLSLCPLAEGKDSYAHVYIFMGFLHLISTGQDELCSITRTNWIKSISDISADYPPFFYFVALLMQLMGSFIINNGALFTSTLAFAVLLFSVYKLGSIRDEQTGALAALICSLYPIIFVSSRHFNIEMTLAAMVSLGVWILYKTDFFENRIFSICLGVIVGLGMLTKQTFFMYLLGPFSFMCLLSLKKDTEKCVSLRKENILRALTVAAALAALFYLNKNMWVSMINRSQFSGGALGDNLLSWGHIFYYIRSLETLLEPVFLVVFILSLFMIRKSKEFFLQILMLWLIVPFCLFMFFKLKYAEYAIAYLPAMALISAQGILSINNKLSRNLIIVFIVVAGLSNFFMISNGRKTFFYARCYAENPIVNIIDHEKFQDTKDAATFEKVAKQIGNSNVLVGVFYDDAGGKFPAYLIRKVFAHSAKKSKIIDFFNCVPGFFDSLELFDIMIFVTCSEKDWIDKESFRYFIEKVNKVNFSKLYLSEDKNVFQQQIVGMNRVQIPVKDLERLITMKDENFTKLYSMEFDDGIAQKVYIYKRVERR